MIAAQTPRQLRLWPGVLAVTIQLALRFVVPIFWPGALEYSVLGGVGCGLLVILWWLFFSRAAWVERVGAILLMALALALTPRILDRSMATGAMGFLFYICAVPFLMLAFVVWAVATRRLPDGVRRATMAVTILLACAAWALVRTNGFTADAVSDFAWRWAPTAEDRLVHAADKSLALPEAPAALKIPLEPVAAKVPSEPAITKPMASWPGFRGPLRNDHVTGTRIATDWSATPPVQLWRRPVGPGWSSFAVGNGVFYTQEQRGSEEIVSCYNLSTGQPLWKHSDAARFWESNAGPGPRGTPTLSKGRVYSFGATGIVNALDARTGAVVWSRNAAADASMKTPEWGFASSPLVLADQVIVAASGKLAAYDIETGEPRWFGPDGGVSYSSPQLLNEQILQLSSTGAIGVAPADGAVLWKHDWHGYPIVQPAVTADGDILISVSDDSGIRRLAIANAAVEERWTSKGLKPYFNDFVVHKGYAYGFDGSLLSAIDLKDGKRAWKGGRYGHGQLTLLEDQDVLLVLSEEGEVALVSATPDQFKELARFKVLEGKTWNHPVVAGDILLVRNGEEMAAFRLR